MDLLEDSPVAKILVIFFVTAMWIMDQRTTQVKDALTLMVSILMLVVFWQVWVRFLEYMMVLMLSATNPNSPRSKICQLVVLYAANSWSLKKICLQLIRV